MRVAATHLLPTVLLMWTVIALACPARAGSSAATNAAPQETPSFQPWVKRGVLIKPGFAGPQSAKLVSCPSVVKLANGRLRMYFWAADGVPPWHGRHVILAAEAVSRNPFEWTLVSEKPLLGPDPSGNIRDRGVGFPFVLPRDDGPWLMYYATWGSWAPPEEISNRTGLAISNDQGLTWQVVRETALPLGPKGSYDAGLTGSVSIVRDAPNRYLMWYTAGERYVHFGERNRGIVHIGAASSQDGIHWTKAPEPALRARVGAVDPYEAVLGKPNVLKVDGVYHMWFSVYAMPPGAKPSDPHERYRPTEDSDRTKWHDITSRELGYHIEYARSTDGIHWERKFDRPVLSSTPGEFDSKNQSYPTVIDMGAQLWMFYVGNEFGSTGIGLATLEKSALNR
jgi:predicted GH43/DUF377 family glycosyl hydrolase